MITLYEELGFEVVADPLGVETLVEGCAACFGGGPEPVRSIYTRRPKEGSAKAGTAPNLEDEGVTERAGETHPTRVLREEHQRILAVADALEALLDAGPAAVDYDRIDKCIRFIRLFADACHHGKEEDLLFPALVDQGLPRERGPIAVMLHEHRLGREIASTMAASIDRARSGDAEAHARLERAGRDYVALIRGHILKEDNVLFNMADQIVLGPACQRLCAAYDGTGDHTFDGCTKAQLEELGREIVAGM
jgi:hemerythrin-like domain-containing protein